MSLKVTMSQKVAMSQKITNPLALLFCCTGVLQDTSGVRRTSKERSSLAAV